MTQLKILFSFILILTLVGCQNQVSQGSSESAEANASSTQGEDVVVADNVIRLNPNDTIDNDFGQGILPNEFVNGEKINHNFMPVYFAYDSAKIESVENSKLKMLAGFLESNNNLYLIVEGHCDESGSEEYNRALSERRALAVKTYIESAAPSVQARINTVGFGEEKPVDTASTPEAFAKNRRAEFIIISKR